MREQRPESSKLVVFDLDGTLIELPIDYQSLKNKLTDEIKIEFQNIFPTVRTLDVKSKRQAFAIIDQYEYEAMKKMKTREGSIEIINKLKAKGIVVSIVTMQGPVAKEIVKAMKLDGSIDSIVTREDSLDRKEQISMILKKHAIMAKDSIVIGDKEADYIAASALGCKGFLVRKINGIPYCELHDLSSVI